MENDDFFAANEGRKVDTTRPVYSNAMPMGDTPVQVEAVNLRFVEKIGCFSLDFQGTIAGGSLQGRRASLGMLMPNERRTDLVAEQLAQLGVPGESVNDLVKNASSLAGQVVVFKRSQSTGRNGKVYDNLELVSLGEGSEPVAKQPDDEMPF